MTFSAHGVPCVKTLSAHGVPCSLVKDILVLASAVEQDVLADCRLLVVCVYVDTMMHVNLDGIGKETAGSDE